MVVSDIGCCSLVDSLLSCHTVHGLHGRAVALAMGVRFGLGKNKKVIAVQGDGGATIGLQHLLEAARLPDAAAIELDDATAAQVAAASGGSWHVVGDRLHSWLATEAQDSD